MDRAHDLSGPRPLFLRSQSDSSSSGTLDAPPYPLRASVDENKPRRPPKNPARSGPNIEPAAVTGKRMKTVTGTQEEVTPWELHPPPASYPAVAPPTSQRISIVSGTAQANDPYSNHIYSGLHLPEVIATAQESAFLISLYYDDENLLEVNNP